MPDQLAFTYRHSRSRAITVALCAIVAIESVAVHFAVAARHPVLAWTLTLTSVAAILWVMRDYLALGTGAVRLDDAHARLSIGRRFDISIPLARIERVFKPTFRDLRAAGTNPGRDFLNLTKPSSPNVLIVLDQLQRVRITLGVHRDARRIAFKLDEPDGFIRAVEERRATIASRMA